MPDKFWVSYVSCATIDVTGPFLFIELTLSFSCAHGAPIHIGDPAAIGISNLERPDWGDRQEFVLGDVPVFWACGVTLQAAAIESKLPLMITHSPGHMFLTDLPNTALATF